MADESIHAGLSSPSNPPSRTWLAIALLLSLIGIGLSVYLTAHHIEVKAAGVTDAACNINATFNCDEVAKSAFSEAFGIPLGVYGLGYFLAMLVLVGVGVLNPKQRREHLHAYAAMAAIGAAASLALGGISAISLGTFCLVCIGVYAVCLLQAVVTWKFRREIPNGVSWTTLTNGGTTAVIVVALVIVAFNFLAPKPSPKLPDARDLDSAADLGPFLSKIENIPINKSPYSGLGEDYRAGSDDAKVVIVEFADFECPACARMGEVLGALKREYGQRILVVFRHYPLDQACNPSMSRPMHKNACLIATLSRCAGHFNKFWEYHDLAFGRQREASSDNAKQWARQIGLSDEQISTCIQDKSIVEKIREDIQIANTVGLTGTPTLYINGRKYVGEKGIMELREEIDKLLSAN